ncbi:hypothetical protein WDW37_14680 [Bdellovibrionota bacterium FG-1]
MNRILRGQILFVFVCAGVLIGAPHHTRADAPIVVKAPCSNDVKSGLHGCQQILISGIPPSGEMKKAVPSVIALLKKQVKIQIEGDKTTQPPTLGYYDHHDPGFMFTVFKKNSNDVAFQSKSDGQDFGPTICNLVGGHPDFAPDKPEGLNPQRQDHFNQSCGNPIQIDAKLLWDGGTPISENCFAPPIPPSPYPLPPTNFRVGIKIHKNWDANPPQGTLEDGYIRGALLQATSCFYQQVINEVQSSHQITISDVEPNIPSPCLWLAKDLAFLEKSHQDSIASLSDKLLGQANIEDILNFDKNWSAPKKTGSIDMGPLRQSAQYLASARAGLEVMFTQLAACEIFARAQFSYLSTFGTPDKQQQFIDSLLKNIADPCSSQCKSKLTHSALCKPSDQAITQCANECYLEKLPSAVAVQFGQFWPNDGKCRVLTP